MVLSVFVQQITEVLFFCFWICAPLKSCSSEYSCLGSSLFSNEEQNGLAHGAQYTAATHARCILDIQINLVKMVTLAKIHQFTHSIEWHVSKPFYSNSHADKSLAHLTRFHLIQFWDRTNMKWLMKWYHATPGIRIPSLLSACMVMRVWSNRYQMQSYTPESFMVIMLAPRNPELLVSKLIQDKLSDLTNDICFACRHHYGQMTSLSSNMRMLLCFTYYTPPPPHPCIHPPTPRNWL